MHKRYAHHLLVRLRAVRYVYLMTAIVIAVTVFIFAYRQNNLTAITLRDKLLQADQQNGDVEGALKRLRSYTYAHMNANLSVGQQGIYPPIQLKYRYERLVATEKARVASVNNALYTQAQTHCEALMPKGVSRDRVPCIQEYVTAHGGATERAIPDALYKFDFVSPIWSPDVAGLSLLVALVLLGILAVRFASERWLERRLREHG